MQNQALSDTLHNVAKKYPNDLVEFQIKDIPRIAFNIHLGLNMVAPKVHNELEICDLGGGIGLFSVGCAAYGMKRVVLIDDFNDPINHSVTDSMLGLHKSLGIEVIARDVVTNGIDDLGGTFDIITSFDSMEHWHHSPKRLFHQVMEKLKPGGVFILGVPNCVNLRKRMSVPFGAGKWSGLEDWYESERFRGHVREPDVDDLVHIAADMGLVETSILGRNWLGYHSANAIVRLATSVIDIPLRLVPSLCSDIYLIGRKT